MKPLIIDTIDFSSYFTNTGYEVRYESVDGGQGGAYMLDGTISVDELTVKAVVTLPLLPLNETQLQTLLETLMPTPLHTVQYYDPWRGTRTVKMKRGNIGFTYRGRGGKPAEYWTKGVIELTEK